MVKNSSRKSRTFSNLLRERAGLDIHSAGEFRIGLNFLQGWAGIRMVQHSVGEGSLGLTFCRKTSLVNTFEEGKGNN